MAILTLNSSYTLYLFFSVFLMSCTDTHSCQVSLISNTQFLRYPLPKYKASGKLFWGICGKFAETSGKQFVFSHANEFSGKLFWGTCGKFAANFWQTAALPVLPFLANLRKLLVNFWQTAPYTCCSPIAVLANCCKLLANCCSHSTTHSGKLVETSGELLANCILYIYI